MSKSSKLNPSLLIATSVRCLSEAQTFSDFPIGYHAVINNRMISVVGLPPDGPGFGQAVRKFNPDFRAGADH